ncbi:MAG: transglycosylase SLT domain-containing protein [Saezia sp.]
MTFTVQKRKLSLRAKASKIGQFFKRSLTAIGFLTVATLTILALDSTLCTKAANALSSWVNSQSVQATEIIAFAPFEFEDVADIERNAFSVTLEGYAKLPVATIATLPVLNLNELTAEQIKITNWLANRYRVAPQMVALLVKEAWLIGEQKKIDPTLILAIAAIESRFNPYAQSEVGATGLMQVMTGIHAAKLERAGGAITVFDPITNLRVGVQILDEHLKRAGSLEGGLKQYVGATGPHDYGYGKKVTEERNRIRRVIFGHSEPDLKSILEVGKKISVQETLESA